MNTYLTGNPIGSSAAKDFFDNTSNTDEFANSELPSFIDRFSKRRETISGLKKMVTDFIEASGNQFMGDYDDGPITITLQNQIFSKDGEYWRAGPALSLPYTTVENWVIDAPKFVSTGDATLRQALAALTGATLVTTASGQTVQEALDASGSDGVLIDGGSTDKSTDDTEAVVAALATGRRLIGDPAKWYGINAITWPSILRIRGVNFYALNPDPLERRVIFQTGGEVCELVDVKIDRNGSGSGGLMGGSAAIYISNCQSTVKIKNCDVTGNNFGDGIVVTDSNILLEDNYVHDMTWGTPSGPAQSDDRMQGIFIVRCTGEARGNFTARLRGQWSGQAPTHKWTRGYSVSGSSDLRMIGNYSDFVDQSFDYSGGDNNRRITSVGCVATNSGSWGFKAANTVTDCVYIGCITFRSGLAGFVASAPGSDIGVPSHLLTQNITYIGCKSISNGWGSTWAGNSLRGGFCASNSAAYPEFPRGIKWIGCQSYGSGESQYGFRNDVAVPGNGTFWNEAINCESANSVTDFIGMNQGSLIRAGASDQAIPSSSATAVNLGVTISDRMNSGSTNIVRRSGLYLINTQVNFQGNANGTRNVTVKVDGSQVQGGSFSAPASPSGTGVGGSLVYRFNAGQAVRIEVTQDSGSTLNLTSAFLAITEMLQGQS